MLKSGCKIRLGMGYRNTNSIQSGRKKSDQITRDFRLFRAPSEIATRQERARTEAPLIYPADGRRARYVYQLPGVVGFFPSFAWLFREKQRLHFTAIQNFVFDFQPLWRWESKMNNAGSFLYSSYFRIANEWTRCIFKKKGPIKTETMGKTLVVQLRSNWMATPAIWPLIPFLRPPFLLWLFSPPRRFFRLFVTDFLQCSCVVYIRTFLPSFCQSSLFDSSKGLLLGPFCSVYKLYFWWPNTSTLPSVFECEYTCVCIYKHPDSAPTSPL